MPNLTNQTLLKIVSLLSIHFKCPRMNETSTSNSLPVVSTMQWGPAFFRETFLIFYEIENNDNKI